MKLQMKHALRLQTPQPQSRQHRAHVDNACVLRPQTPRRWYSYKVHGGRVLRFQAPPPPGRKEGFQFLVYGDMGDPDHRKAKAPG